MGGCWASLGNVTELPTGFGAKAPSLSKLPYFLETGCTPVGASLEVLLRS